MGPKHKSGAANHFLSKSNVSQASAWVRNDFSRHRNVPLSTFAAKSFGRTDIDIYFPDLSPHLLTYQQLLSCYPNIYKIHMRNLVLATTILAVFLATASAFTLYTGGNSWSLLGRGQVPSTNFTFPVLPAKFSTYFYTDTSGAQFNLSISMTATVSTTAVVTIGTTKRSVIVPANNNFAPVFIGSFFSYRGYNQIITSLSGSQLGYGKVVSFDVSGALADLSYVPDNEGSNFYWGRRGSSANFSPGMSGAKKVRYYYSEIYVPAGFDPVGSYYMANGFSQGYMGIQVNSPTERKVLFSVWSGFVTDDPEQIPTEYTVTVNRIGPGVTKGTFGGEGSGAQTYLVLNWQPGVTYGFLTKAIPLTTDATNFTAWFYDPSNATNGGWRLIAEMTRPKVKTSLTGIHSFIECFDPDKGNQTRMGYYGNQWYYDSTNTWKESISASLGVDDAFRTKIRRDVEGGVYNRNMYILKSGGFFNTSSASGTVYTRIAKKIPPNVNFATLP